MANTARAAINRPSYIGVRFRCQSVVPATDVRAQLKDAEAQVAKCAAVAMDADFQTAMYKLDWARAQLAAAGHGATH